MLGTSPRSRYCATVFAVIISLCSLHGGRCELYAEPVNRGEPPSLHDPAGFGLAAPSLLLDASFLDRLALDGGSGAVHFREVRSIFPFAGERLENGLAWGVSFSAGWANFDLSGNRPFHEDLFAFEFPTVFTWSPRNSRVWTLLYLAPGIGTDLEGIDGNDLRLRAIGLVGYQFSDTLSIAAGVFSNYALGDGFGLPTLGVVWRPGPLIVQVAPPYVVLGWRAHEKVLLSATVYPAGGAWDLDGADQPNSVRLSGWQGAVAVQWSVSKHTRIALRAGWQFSGELELRDHSERVVLNERLENAPVIGMTFRWEL